MRNLEMIIRVLIAVAALVVVGTAALVALCGGVVPLPSDETCAQCVRNWISALGPYVGSALALVAAWATIRQIRKQIDLANWQHAAEEIEKLVEERKALAPIESILTHMRQFQGSHYWTNQGTPGPQKHEFGPPRDQLASKVRDQRQEMNLHIKPAAGGRKLHACRQGVEKALDDQLTAISQCFDEMDRVWKSFPDLQPTQRLHRSDRYREIAEECGFDKCVAAAIETIESVRDSYRKGLESRIADLRSRYNLD